MHHPIDRCSSVIKVVPLEGEDFERTIKRFNKAVRKEYDRAWHKRRYGYYEKPSVLRRKRMKIKWRNNIRFRHGAPSTQFYMDLELQWRREGPSNAIER
jgi:ribosomal protein S21